jgi:hypothetical protein
MVVTRIGDPRMRTQATTLLLLASLTACSKPPEPQAKTQPQTAPSKAKQDPPVVLAAAGVALTLPSTWTIFDDHEVDFAFARGPGDNPPTCTIELHRQSSGDPPKGARNRDGDIDFTRGVLRGRVRALPGPGGNTTVVIQCLAPHATQWAAIDAAFDSQTSAPIEPGTNSPNTSTGPIAQLCTGTPANQTYVCVRRDDGAVYCGPSDGDVLTRIIGIEPAVQIACEGTRACSRTASGSLHCWRADEGAQPVPEITQARDLAGGCVVDSQGTLRCRQRADNGATTNTFAELSPFGDPAFALSDVEHVLAGTGINQGCVLTTTGLHCWDNAAKLALPLADNHQPHTLAGISAGTDLATIGGRVCVAGPERWTCLDGEKRAELDGCERRPCGCTLLGAMRLSCDHEPFEYGHAPLGRIADVVAVDGTCAVLRDGTVVCRGPVAGQVEDSPRVLELVTGGRSGVLHVLELREASE